ncbi:MAG: carbon storage regulator [Pirellulaceae bacterium]
MLVLSRKLKQQIIIDHQIVVTILAVRGNQVKLGVVGPAAVPIRRIELTQYPPPIGGKIRSSPATFSR